MEDIEIARNAKLINIQEIAKKAGINEEILEQYGKYKAKIDSAGDIDNRENENGKLVLVTALSPTPMGEGKTTVSIAIADGLARLGKKAMLTLREPSLGPVFGMKGGATGGGMVQVAPMEDINLHFTGDIHAITSANNLLSSMIDNHIFHGNSLGIKKVIWKRCVDLNDRQLRKVNTGLSGEKNMVSREDGFDITVASEIMAILCLASDIYDLKEKLSNIIVGYNNEEKPVFVKDLKAEGSMTVLLKDAIKPNLVQTLENTPAIIHGGPFANIAHGCNSIIATKYALKLSDYAITEAGFGADLGAEKFLNIKCRKSGITPNVVVIVATIKAIKYHGGVEKEKIQEENVEAIDRGINNIYKHINNMKNEFGLNVIVALNRYDADSDDEVKYVEKLIKNKDVEFSTVEGWAKGSLGAEDIANKICQITSANENKKINYTYDLEDSIELKIEKVAKKIYGADGVEFTEEVLEKIEKIENKLDSKLPICIAKTQFSFSDDSKKIGTMEPFKISVKDVVLKNGAGFILVLTGNVMTMPGLSKEPAAEKINIDENGETTGIF